LARQPRRTSPRIQLAAGSLREVLSPADEAMMLMCCCANDDGQMVETVAMPAIHEEKAISVPAVEEPAQDEDPPAVEEAPPVKEEKAKMEEPPKPAAPPAPVEELPKSSYYYEVSLDKRDKPLGLKLESKRTCVGIAGVAAGVVDDHNKSAEPAKKIQALDFICSVNGKTKAEEIIEAMKEEGALQMKLFRPLPFNVTLNKERGILGLHLFFHADSSSIEVESVVEGLAKDYNATVSEELQIKAKDCIKSVNGVSGDGQKILVEVKTANKLDMVIVRGPA